MAEQWVNEILRALESYNLKQESRTEYRCNSPLRPGSDSHAFCINTEKMVYTDHARNESGTLRQLARTLGIVVQDPRQQAANTKRSYRDMAEYAEIHGAPVEAFTAMKWEQVTYQGRPAMKIPTRGGDRYRFLDSGVETHKAPGYKKCWYGLQSAIKIATEKRGSVIICNGEPSTAVGLWYEASVCCVPGGEADIPENLLTEFNAVWTGPVIIALDCDDKGRMAARKMAQQFNDVTPNRAMIVDLGLTDKGDVADFCKLHQKDSRVEIEARAEYPRKEPGKELEVLQDAAKQLGQYAYSQKVQDGTAILEAVKKVERAVASIKPQEMPKVHTVSGLATICEAEFNSTAPYKAFKSGLIDLDNAIGGFAPRQMVTIYGSSGMGKSTLAISIIAAFANGAPGLVIPTECADRDWLNKLTAYHANVPYSKIARKTADAAERERIGKAYPAIAKQQMTVLSSSTTSMAHIRAELENPHYPYEWILVDSINRMVAPGKDGIYERIVACSNFLQSIAQEFNLAVIVTSQVAKDISKRQNKMPMPEDAYGGAAVWQDSDVVLGLYYHHYYVKLGQEQPDSEYPENVALLRTLKHRWDVGQTGVKLWFNGGIGFSNYVVQEAKYPLQTRIVEPKVIPLFDVPVEKELRYE